MCLDARKGRWWAGEEDWDWVDFLAGMVTGVCGDGFRLWGAAGVGFWRVGKVGFRRVSGCIWVGFRELWSKEFWGEEVLGSELEMG